MSPDMAPFNDYRLSCPGHKHPEHKLKFVERSRLRTTCATRGKNPTVASKKERHALRNDRNTKVSVREVNEDLRDFAKFMKRREEAGRAYVCGDPDPLREITTWNSPATFFGPKGGSCEGADKVWSNYEDGAGMFAPGSNSSFEVLHREASNGVAYWVGFQRALVRMRGRDEPVPYDLRITEIFRREGGEWKLVHRHADPLSEVSDEKKAKAQVRRPSRPRKLLAAK